MRVLTLGQWLDVLDMAWEKSQSLAWHERAPYYSLIASVAVYVRIFADTGRVEDRDLGASIAIPYSAIDGLNLEIVAIGEGVRMVGVPDE